LLPVGHIVKNLNILLTILKEKIYNKNKWACIQWCSKTTKLQDQDHLFFKTTFSRPLFLKTIKLLNQDHWRSQKFWLGGA